MKIIRFLLTAITIFCFTEIFAQATVKGTLYNKETNEKLIGATVTLKDNSNKVLTDASDKDGEFRFRDLTVGNYTLEIDYVGFKPYTQRLQLQNKKMELKILLDENQTVLSDVHVFTKINEEHEASSRISEKNANNITNVISAQAMQRSPDINAANV
ncbi:MAG: carboxypeptidase-like regulatory domain-containing protein, partial [Bacteroidota bacterium]|nr:carboxypeptidase-like regulatory domain-containing protein [Bacteroidota bacterium]